MPPMSKRGMRRIGGLNVISACANRELLRRIVYFVTVADDGIIQNVSISLRRHSNAFRQVMMSIAAPHAQKRDPTRAEYHGQISMVLKTSWLKLLPVTKSLPNGRITVFLFQGGKSAKHSYLNLTACFSCLITGLSMNQLPFTLFRYSYQ